MERTDEKPRDKKQVVMRSRCGLTWEVWKRKVSTFIRQVVRKEEGEAGWPCP